MDARIRQCFRSTLIRGRRLQRSVNGQDDAEGPRKATRMGVHTDDELEDEEDEDEELLQDSTSNLHPTLFPSFTWSENVSSSDHPYPLAGLAGLLALPHGALQPVETPIKTAGSTARTSRRRSRTVGRRTARAPAIRGAAGRCRCERAKAKHPSAHRSRGERDLDRLYLLLSGFESLLSRLLSLSRSLPSGLVKESARGGIAGFKPFAILLLLTFPPLLR
eukprot:571640-Hanusia_phi.AAC.5